MASASLMRPEARLPVTGGRLLDTETKALVQRWITAFGETPVLIDASLMRRVLADLEGRREGRKP